MRGIENEDVVIEVVRNLKVVREVFQVVLLALRYSTHLVCYPDSIGFVEAEGTEGVLLEVWGEVHHDGKLCWIGRVVIKTKVAERTVGAALEIVRSQPVFCDIIDNICHRFIPTDHLMQVVQNATVVKVSLVIYVVASETRVM